jgi:hypothetical protein
MKALITAVALAFATASFAADAPKKDVKPAENTNCVKKDKNGKCPPLPDSPKPTPKKKAEEKK